jgi:hypothetical protein
MSRGPANQHVPAKTAANQLRLGLHGMLPFISISLTCRDYREAVDYTRQGCWLLHARKLGSSRKEIKGPIPRSNTTIKGQHSRRSTGILRSPSYITTVPLQLPNVFLINALRYPYSTALRTCRPTPPPLSSELKSQARPRLPSDSSRTL